jgi:hypothetical protein
MVGNKSQVVNNYRDIKKRPARPIELQRKSLFSQNGCAGRRSVSNKARWKRWRGKNRGRVTELRVSETTYILGRLPPIVKATTMTTVLRSLLRSQENEAAELCTELTMEG